MAESVVLAVRQTLGKLLVDEAKFLWGVKGKVEDLQKELKVIQCLLRDADANQDHTVRECVAQLRDIAYDAEDIIEQYILRVAPEKGQNIIIAYACFMAKCTCVRAHVVRIKIDGLRSNIRNHKMIMDNYGIELLNESEYKHARASTPKLTYAHFEEEDLVGREDSIKVLVNELLKDGEQYRVISIWGMGGLGKTALAKKVFAHDKVKKHFNFNGFAWVCISQEYHVRDILERILVKLNPDQREGVTKMKDDELLETLYETQKQKRCFVVLDDIWTKQAWDSLRAAFPIKDTSSKLLITTRNKEVAQHIDPHCFLHELKCLSNEESWVLLKKNVFPKTKGLVVEISSDGPEVSQDIVASQAIEDIAKQSETEGQIPVITEDMKELAYELLKKCAGLPLAVIVLGRLLAVNKWETIYKKINWHFSDKSDLSKVLDLSYDNLPWHLKPCFLYLGCFPEDAEIPAPKILHMWIAEGFVSHEREIEISVEDIAEQYLTELVNRGMVQLRFKLNGKIKSCHLHDLMRDFCISRASHENFLSDQDNEVKNESSCKIRRLSSRNVIPSFEARVRTLVHLRTLVSFEEVAGEKEIQSIFNHCKFLRVLKLEKLYWMMKNLPESMGDLVHLRFLSLAGSRFNGLPQSMGNLVCMEFLDLVKSDDYITVSIPNVLWKMRRLRYLGLPYDFAVKEKFPWDQKKLWLSTLKNLRTIRNFNPKKCDVNDVGKLTNLQKLTVFDNNNPMELEIFPQLVALKLKHLRSLSFHVGNFKGLWTEAELSKMSNYPHSYKLCIDGKIEKLPEHKSLPQQLRKLVLIMSYLQEDPMPILEKLNNLVFLMLGCFAFVGKEMVCSAGGFPQLKRLLFFQLHDLEEWRAAEGAVPLLSRLGIADCPKLTVVPSHVSKYNGWDEILHEMNMSPL